MRSKTAVLGLVAVMAVLTFNFCYTKVALNEVVARMDLDLPPLVEAQQAMAERSKATTSRRPSICSPMARTASSSANTPRNSSIPSNQH